MDTREFNKLYNDMRHPSNDEPMYNIGITSLPHGYQYGGRIGYADGTPASGLALTSVKPTQQAIDDFVNMPVYMGQMMPPASELLANETYQDYVRRKRRETGPPLFSESPGQNITPISDSLLPKGMTNEISNLIYYGPHDNSIANWKGLSPDNPSTGYVKVEPTSSTPNLPVDQIAALSSRDKLIRSLNSAGFNSSDINTILLKYGYADGGAIGYSNGGLAPITAGMSIAPGYAHGGYISQGQPVNTHLTTTIPPVRGPMSQGVETLFKRRYS